MREIDRPVPFAGTQEERIANRRTHSWSQTYDGEYVCFDCEVKPYHVSAEYACGAHVPRETIQVPDEAAPVEMSRGFASLIDDIEAGLGADDGL